MAVHEQPHPAGHHRQHAAGPGRPLGRGLDLRAGPEYNHGFNAAIKNALDYLNAEWRGKAVGFVSYGGVAAGTRAVQMLKPVLAALKMVPLNDAVNIPFVQQFLDAERTLQPNEIMESAAGVLLNELVAWSAALRSIREPAAPVS